MKGEGPSSSSPSSPSVFVLGGRGASQLPGCEGGRAVVVVVAVVAVCFCFGRAGGQSALELGVKLFVAVASVLSVFVLGRAGGQSASGAVKGEGGPVSFGVGCETVRRRRLFLFWGPVSFRAVKGEGPSSPSSSSSPVFVLGGRGASQLWSCVVLFCGEWRRVSFRGAKGGESALELGVKLFVVAVVVVCFCFGAGGGASQLPGL